MMEARAEQTVQAGQDGGAGGLPLLALLTRPGAYLAGAAAGPLPVHHPLAALALAGFIQVLSLLVLRSPPAGFSAFALTAGFFILLAGKTMALLAVGIAVHFFATAMAGPERSGRGWRLFGLLLACQLPFLFLLPSALIARLAGPWAGFLFFFLHTLVMIWTLWLMIEAVKENYALSSLKAVLAFLLPGLLLWAGSAALFSSVLFRIALLVV